MERDKSCVWDYMYLLSESFFLYSPYINLISFFFLSNLFTFRNGVMFLTLSILNSYTFILVFFSCVPLIEFPCDFLHLMLLSSFVVFPVNPFLLWLISSLPVWNIVFWKYMLCYNKCLQSESKKNLYTFPL